MKLIPIIGASVLALALSGTAFAAEQSQQNPAATPPEAVKDGGDTGVTQRNRGGDDAKREQDYQAELKKCDSAADKAKCQDSAKKKYNQM